MFFTKLTGLFVGLERFREIIQADVVGGHVAQGRRDTFRVVVLKQALISALITINSLYKAILPRINVADVDFKTGKPPGIAFIGKDLSGALSGRKGAAVFAKKK